jgi:CheY-like chemotaxis protein
MNQDSIDITSGQLKRFYYLQEGKFTGVLDVRSTIAQWSVLFNKGKIVWAIDRIYPHRFWKRQLLTHLPHVSLQQLAQITQNLAKEQEIQPAISWPYLGLVQLYNNSQIDSQTLGSLLADAAQDVLFDILQASHTTDLIYRTDNHQFSQPPPIIMAFEKLIIVPQQNWKEWQDHNLANIFPDQIPVIDQPQILYQQTTTAIYSNLAQIIDSYYSLREIAIHQQQDLFLLARSLAPHLQRQTISLHQMRQDLPLPTVEVATITAAPTTANPVTTITKPDITPVFRGLIAYIDDNGCANEYMANIINSIGYQFLGIKDVGEALDRLQQSPPNLIIMEAAMPLTSGRQICQQIRRSQQLSTVPVILIVDQESITERILAKLAGAARIITHPLDQDKVNELVKHYIGDPPSIPTISPAD